MLNINKIVEILMDTVIKWHQERGKDRGKIGRDLCRGLYCSTACFVFREKVNKEK